MIGSAKAESQSGCAALGAGRLRHPFRDAGDAPFQHRRADHPGIGADEGRPARRQAQRGSNFLKAVRHETMLGPLRALDPAAVTEVAALLNVRKSDAYSTCDRGGLRYVKFEGIVQVEGRDLKAWLAGSSP